MISSISEIPDLNKYATKTFENDCFVDLEGGELCLSYLYLLAVISVWKNVRVLCISWKKSKGIADVSYGNYQASDDYFVSNFCMVMG